MVMARSESPKRSIAGSALVVALASVGWLATPARSSPPEGELAGDTRGPVVVPTVSTTFGDDTATVVHSAQGRRYILAGGHDQTDVGQRLSELETKLDHFGEILDRLSATLSPEPQHYVPRAPRTPRQPREPRHILAIPGGESEGPLVARTYELSEGKLEALTDLMVLNDVPILVRPGEYAIEVHATEEHQGIFAGFVDLITRESTTRTYHLTDAKLEALAALMVRPDVPTLVQPDDNSITVHGTTIEQDTFAAFVNMIHPSGEVSAEAGGHEEHFGHDFKDKIKRKIKQFTKQRKRSKQKAHEHKKSKHEAHKSAHGNTHEGQVRIAVIQALEGGCGKNAGHAPEVVKAKLIDLAKIRSSIEDEIEGTEHQAEALEHAAEALRMAADTLRQQEAASRGE